MDFKTDLVLTILACVVFGVLLVALIPSLTEINIWWIAAVVILLAIKPVYKALR